MNAQKDFFEALSGGDFTTARDLFARKRVGVNARQEHGPHRGRTALMAAVAHDDLDLVAALIEAGADVDACGTEHHSTALMLAAEEGKVRALHVLLAHGAKTDILDVYGRTAAHYAVLNHPEQAIHLYRAGANFDLPDEDWETARAAFERTAKVRSLERTMRELEDLAGLPPVYGPSSRPVPVYDELAVTYFGHVHADHGDDEFLESLGLSVGEYDFDARKFDVSVPGPSSVDVTQFLTSFKYDFELLPVSGALLSAEPCTLEAKDRRALSAYIKYEIGVAADDERVMDLVDRRQALDAAASVTPNTREPATTLDVNTASNEP
ncbi:MAG: ankyrin repeat domain-containing protein [Burkholderia gladioli]